MTNILYLLNHKTLTDFEVPILNKKGYGVLLPKNYDSINPYSSINYLSLHFYDNYVHIPLAEIQELNKIDWFSNKAVTDRILNLINKHFCYIFITLLTEKQLLTQLINHFNGIIYYRLFGFDGDKSYAPMVRDYTSPKVKYIFSYPEIYQYEKTKSSFFNDENSLVIRLGLSNSLIGRLRKTYNPIHPRVILVCPRIDLTGEYYHKIYQSFKTQFKDINHIILGKHNGKVVNDSTVYNNLPDEMYYSEIAKSACMYYHSEEPRHLHYHPLEAIVISIPIIFYEASLLANYLPNSLGKCKDIGEILYKIHRILNGDKSLIELILAEQEKAFFSLTQMNHVNSFDSILKIS